jgi:hypothetical protein
MRTIHARHPVIGKVVAVCGDPLGQLTFDLERVTCTSCVRYVAIVPGLRAKIAATRQPSLWSSDATDDEA